MSEKFPKNAERDKNEPVGQSKHVNDLFDDGFLLLLGLFITKIKYTVHHQNVMFNHNAEKC